MEIDSPEYIDKKRHYTRQFLIAFALFDIIHLVCATVLLVLAFVDRPIEVIDATECFAEIVFAILLMSFIHAMQHHHKYLDHPQVTFTLGCLTASASLFVPLTLVLPVLVESDWAIKDDIPLLVLMSIALFFAFVCFLSFFLALHSSGKRKLWATFIIIGLLSMVAIAPVEFALDFVEGNTGATLVFRLIKALAPVAFAPACILLVVSKKNRDTFFFDIN